MEEGEARPLAWSSVVDEADGQSHLDGTDHEDTDIGYHRLYEELNSSEDVTESAPFATRGAPASGGPNTRQQADDYYALGASAYTYTAAIPGTNTNQSVTTQELAACRLPFLTESYDPGNSDFEVVEDLPSLPRLDFKPIILCEGTLIAVAIFYSGIIAGVGLLYDYENAARIFHVHATASRFSIRFLPSIIGTLSTLIFQAVQVNFARIMPYILMAHPQHSSVTASRTILPHYFPIANLYDMFANRHFYILLMALVRIYLNSFITPAKSTLIHKRASDQDPNLWTISISGGAAKYLLFNYSVLLTIVLGLLTHLRKRRTGLKWDPVSLADHMVLLQGSDALLDFSGLEYLLSSASTLDRKKDPLLSLKSEKYRLGYWRHRPTNQYWHGIRKWPSHEPEVDQSVELPRSDATQSHQDSHLVEASQPADLPAQGRSRITPKDVPASTDQSREAMTWWRNQCNNVLGKPNSCYRLVYFLISDYVGAFTYFAVVCLTGVGFWVLWKGHLDTGFTFPSSDYLLADLILVFLPTFLIGLLNGYWNQIDAWYRQLQPYMGMRQPSLATENLLLGYPGDLPIVITLKALVAGHWRLALTSTMPLVQRTLQVLIGSLLTIDNTSSKSSFHIIIAPMSFKATLGILCAYLVLIPVVWPGLDRRLPMRPLCIADSITMFYDSTLVRKDAFLPRRVDEKRWHMEYRLCLEERRYGFGIYPGRYGALHLGIDDVYGYHQDEKGLRFVAPVKPPMRSYRRWLRSARLGLAKRLHIKRQPTLLPEEFEALQRLQTQAHGSTEDIHAAQH